MFLLYLFIILSIPLGTLLARNLLKKQLKKSYEKNNGKRKILYLRAFARDGEATEMAPALMNPLAFIAKNQGNPHELGLAATLMHCGHLVAIGKPDEPIPEIGFERLYFSDDTWKEEVIKLMNESALIIYRPDTSDSVLWEFEQILNSKSQSKVIIWTGVFLNFEEELQKVRYRIFSRKFFTLFKVVLPEYKRFRKFVSCDENGEWVQTKDIKDTYAFKRLDNIN